MTRWLPSSTRGRSLALLLLTLATALPTSDLSGQRGVPRRPAARPTVAHPAPTVRGSGAAAAGAAEAEALAAAKAKRGTSATTASGEEARRTLSRGKSTVTASAVEESRRLLEGDDLPAAKAKLSAPGVDQHDPDVRYSAAIIELTENAKLPPRQRSHANSTLLFDELNARITRATSAEEHLRLEALGTTIAGTELLTATPSSHERYDLASVGSGQMVSWYGRTTQFLGRLLNGARQIPENALIYVQNDAALSARDWTPQALQAGTSLVPSGLELFLLADSPLSALRPYALSEPANDGTQVDYVRQSTVLRPDPLVSGRNGNPCRASLAGQPERCPPIVLVRKRGSVGTR